MINRLLGIIYILLNRGTVTAKELAERFEVSTRTIYRDVEALSMAGIPVYARKGKNGGICLTERFVLDRLVVSDAEQKQILAALASLQETGADQEGEILRKLGDFFQTEPVNWVAIDFSDWSGGQKELFEQIRQSILGRRVMEFDYYGRYGEMTHRAAEPLQLLFKDYTWYVRAYCRKRQAMRLFKVRRMKRVQVLEEIFPARVMLSEEPEDEQLTRADPAEGQGVLMQEYSEVILRIEGKEAYRIYDKFEEYEITRLEDGDFEVRMWCYVDDWVYGLILSFGPSARVLGPENVRKEMEKRIGLMKEMYERDRAGAI